MIEIGLRANLTRPTTPMYLLRQPADQSRMEYSRPKKNTRTISWNATAWLNRNNL